MIQFIDKYVLKYDHPRKVVKAMLYLKLLEENIRLTDNDLMVLCLFTEYDSIKQVAKEAIKSEYKNSVRSAENTVSDLVELGILIKKGTDKRAIREDLIPDIKSDTIALNCKIHNVKSS